MKVPRCRGTSDLTPYEMEKFRHVEAQFINCCTGWGYQEIRTPTLEYLQLFTSAGTLSPDMLGRIYSFLDWDGWSGERVVLRPDGTIPAARFYVENFGNIPLARLFYIENMFAFEGTGTESRERWQCGAELIGVSRPEGDVELISMALDAVGRLGIDSVDIRLAHAGLLRAILEESGLTGEEEAGVLDRIFSGDLDVLGGIDSGNPDLQRNLQLLFGIKGTSAAYVENLRGAFASLPALGPDLDELAHIAALLTDLGLNYQIDFASGKGFEYYTGIIFGFYSTGGRLGGGGRYDELIPLVGGGNICASGFGLYMDRIMQLLKALPERDRILVRAKAPEGFNSSLEIARLLRDEGYITETDLGFEDTSDFRWIVEASVGGEIGLIDQLGGKKRRQSSISALLKALKEAECR